MKSRETARKAAYIGAAAGFVIFATIGLLPGSFIGGAVGLNIAESLFGSPLASEVIPRAIVSLSMVLGVLVSALGIITASAVAGWFVGSALQLLRSGKPVAAAAKR